MTEIDRLNHMVTNLENGGWQDSTEGALILSKAVLAIADQVSVLTVMYRDLNPIITKEMIDEMEEDFK